MEQNPLRTFPPRPKNIDQVEWGPLPSHVDYEQAFTAWALPNKTLKLTPQMKESGYCNYVPEVLVGKILRNVRALAFLRSQAGRQGRKADVDDPIENPQLRRTPNEDGIDATGWRFDQFRPAPPSASPPPPPPPPPPPAANAGQDITYQGKDIFQRGNFRKEDLGRILGLDRKEVKRLKLLQLQTMLYDREKTAAAAALLTSQARVQPTAGEHADKAGEAGGVKEDNGASLLPRSDLSKWGIKRKDNFAIPYRAGPSYSAFDLYTWAIHLSPYNPTYWISRAYLYYQKGHYDLALGDAYRSHLLVETMENLDVQGSHLGLHARVQDALEQHLLCQCDRLVEAEKELKARRIRHSLATSGVGGGFCKALRKAICLVITQSLLGCGCDDDYPYWDDYMLRMMELKWPTKLQAVEIPSVETASVVIPSVEIPSVEIPLVIPSVEIPPATPPHDPNLSIMYIGTGRERDGDSATTSSFGTFPSDESMSVTQSTHQSDENVPPSAQVGVNERRLDRQGSVDLVAQVRDEEYRVAVPQKGDEEDRDVSPPEEDRLDRRHLELRQKRVHETIGQKTTYVRSTVGFLAHEKFAGRLVGQRIPQLDPGVDRTQQSFVEKLTSEYVQNWDGDNQDEPWLRIDTDDSQGGLKVVARRDIPPGTLIYADEPNVRGHRQYLGPEEWARKWQEDYDAELEPINYLAQGQYGGFRCENCKQPIPVENVQAKRQTMMMKRWRDGSRKSNCRCVYMDPPLVFCDNNEVPDPTVEPDEVDFPRKKPRLSKPPAKAHDDPNEEDRGLAGTGAGELPRAGPRDCHRIACELYHYRACNTDWRWLHEAMTRALPSQSETAYPNWISHGTILSLLLREVFDTTLMRRELAHEPNLHAHEIDIMLPLSDGINGPDHGDQPSETNSSNDGEQDKENAPPSPPVTRGATARTVKEQNKANYHFTWAANIAVPFDILECLGVNIFRDLSFDTWVIQSVLRKLHNNVVPWARLPSEPHTHPRRAPDRYNWAPNDDNILDTTPDLENNPLDNLYLHTGFALFNHGCRDSANAVWKWDRRPPPPPPPAGTGTGTGEPGIPNKILVTSSQFIPAGDEVRVNYWPRANYPLVTTRSPPEVASPQAPAPQAPAAQVPTPQVPAPQVPAPQAPAPQAPAPQTPTPQSQEAALARHVLEQLREHRPSQQEYRGLRYETSPSYGPPSTDESPSYERQQADGQFREQPPPLPPPPPPPPPATRWEPQDIWNQEYEESEARRQNAGVVAALLTTRLGILGRDCTCDLCRRSDTVGGGGGRDAGSERSNGGGGRDAGSEGLSGGGAAARRSTLAPEARRRSKSQARLAEQRRRRRRSSSSKSSSSSTTTEQRSSSAETQLA
ncbi:MAG: hypothetical protein M1837_001393 [Sclerophora amabilis]|nr:MAG: hypothetical protein M1837_001393 [Sclerophora amabilis]